VLSTQPPLTSAHDEGFFNSQNEILHRLGALFGLKQCSCLAPVISEMKTCQVTGMVSRIAENGIAMHDVMFDEQEFWVRLGMPSRLYQRERLNTTAVGDLCSDVEAVSWTVAYSMLPARVVRSVERTVGPSRSVARIRSKVAKFATVCHAHGAEVSRRVPALLNSNPMGPCPGGHPSTWASCPTQCKSSLQQFVSSQSCNASLVLDVIAGAFGGESNIPDAVSKCGVSVPATCPSVDYGVQSGTHRALQQLNMSPTPDHLVVVRVPVDMRDSNQISRLRQLVKGDLTWRFSIGNKFGRDLYNHDGGTRFPGKLAYLSHWDVHEELHFVIPFPASNTGSQPQLSFVKEVYENLTRISNVLPPHDSNRMPALRIVNRTVSAEPALAETILPELVGTSTAAAVNVLKKSLTPSPVPNHSESRCLVEHPKGQSHAFEFYVSATAGSLYEVKFPSGKNACILRMRVQVNNQNALFVHRTLHQGKLDTDGMLFGEWISASTNGYSTSNKLSYINAFSHNGGNFPHGTELYVTMKALKQTYKRRFVGVFVEDTVQLQRPDSRLNLFDDAAAIGCGYASYDRRGAATPNFKTNFGVWSWAGPVFMSRVHRQVDGEVKCATGNLQEPFPLWNSWGAFTQPQLNLTNAALCEFALRPSAAPSWAGFIYEPFEYLFSACTMRQNAAVDNFFMQARADPNTCNQA